MNHFESLIGDQSKIINSTDAYFAVLNKDIDEMFLNHCKSGLFPRQNCKLLTIRLDGEQSSNESNRLKSIFKLIPSNINI